MLKFDVTMVVDCFIQRQSTTEEIDLMMLIAAQMGLSEARDMLMLSHLCKDDHTLALKYLKDNPWIREHVSYDDHVVGTVVRRMSNCICQYINENDGL